MHRAEALIIDDASLHAVGFILAQKHEAVAGIGDPGRESSRPKVAGITPKAFGATTSRLPTPLL